MSFLICWGWVAVSWYHKPRLDCRGRQGNALCTLRARFYTSHSSTPCFPRITFLFPFHRPGNKSKEFMQLGWDYQYTQPMWHFPFYSTIRLGSLNSNPRHCLLFLWPFSCLISLGPNFSPFEKWTFIPMKVKWSYIGTIQNIVSSKCSRAVHEYSAAVATCASATQDGAY